jgi:hypothetical protein
MQAHISAVLTGGRAIFGPGKARELLHPDWTVSEGAFLDRPKAVFDLSEGFAQSVVWYRANGWLKGQTI